MYIYKIDHKKSGKILRYEVKVIYWQKKKKDWKDMKRRTLYKSWVCNKPLGSVGFSGGGGAIGVCVEFVKDMMLIYTSFFWKLSSQVQSKRDGVNVTIYDSFIGANKAA